MRVHKLFWGKWCWECDVCHYGENIPWREAESFEAAWREVDLHLQLHRAVGKQMEWASVARLHDNLNERDATLHSLASVAAELGVDLA